MRVFITSTPAELAPHRAAACEVVRELGFEPVLRPPDDGGEPFADCARQVAKADAVLALVGWRCGPTPEPEVGGDGVRPWARWEVDHAWEQGKTVRALLAGDAWRRERDDDPDAIPTESAKSGRTLELIPDGNTELGRGSPLKQNLSTLGYDRRALPERPLSSPLRSCRQTSPRFLGLSGRFKPREMQR